MLSGGLDSRNIAVHIPRNRGDVHAFTFGQRGCKDVKLAEKVSSKLQFKHHYIELTSKFLPEFAEMTVYLLEGMTSVFTGWDIKAATRVKEEGVDILLEGSSGNAIFGANPYGTFVKRALLSLPLVQKLFTHELYYTFPDNELSSKVYEQLYDELGHEEYPLEKLLSKNYYMKVRDLVGKSLRKAVDEASKYNQFPTNIKDHVYLNELTRRWNITARDSFRSQVETVDPFLDYDLVDFICSVPIEFKIKRFICHRLLKMFYPALNSARAHTRTV
jgi:asparagine synthetase B (glutamine-hydrolysing)